MAFGPTETLQEELYYLHFTDEKIGSELFDPKILSTDNWVKIRI